MITILFSDDYVGVNSQNREVFNELCQELTVAEKEIMSQLVIDSMPPDEVPESLKGVIDRVKGLTTKREKDEEKSKEEMLEAKETSQEQSVECDKIFETLKKKINNGESFVINSQTAFDMLTQCN